MTAEVLNALLEASRLNQRLHITNFDSELTDLIEAAAADLIGRNAIQPAQLESLPVDPLIKQAILTYVKSRFGTPENPERLKADYEDQKATLMTSTGYTDWGGI